jgi:hypothetical protein
MAALPLVRQALRRMDLMIGRWRMRRPLIRQRRRQAVVLAGTRTVGGLPDCSSEPAPPASFAARASFEVPKSISADTDSYRGDVAAATAQVDAFFRREGIVLPGSWQAEHVRVFLDSEAARRVFIARYVVPAEQFPKAFAGTVQDGTLFLIAPRAYRSIWARLYPNWLGRDEEYRKLIVHEFIHAAHERYAQGVWGSADAMGPQGFFEGLAIAAAGQFNTTPLFEPEQILAAIEAAGSMRPS